VNEGRLHRTLSWAAAIPAALLFVPLALPMITGRMFAHTDLAVFHLPLRRFYSEQLIQGQQFLWSSNLFHGFYVHGEGQVGAFHPLHILLYRFLPLVTAFNIEVTISYLFTFAGMWLFLRQIGLAAASCTVGAMSLAFSGFYLLRLGHPNAVAIAAHIPWLLLAMDLSLSALRWRRALGVAAIAGLTGSQVLLGYPQYVWISAVACATYAAIRWREAGSHGARLLLLLAAVAGVFIGGVQLLPTLDLLSDSQRAVTGTDFRLTFSLHPFNLVQLWSPYALPRRVHALPGELFVHEFGLYSGALSTLALVWLFIRRRRLPFPRLAAFAGALCVIGLVLALGRYGLVYEWLAAVPVLGAFRASARHILLIHLGLALLAAITYEDLVRSNRESLPSRALRRWLNLPWILSAATAGAGLLWWFVAAVDDRPPGYPAALLTGVGFFVVGTTLLSDAARGVKAALFILPTLMALDLGIWGYSYVLGSPPLTLEEVTALADPPPLASGSLNVHDRTGSGAVNYLLLSDARILRPYVGLYPRRVLSPSSDAALRVGGVEWVKSADGWNRVADPAPRARIVAQVQTSRDPASDVDHIDILRVALVDRDIPGPLASPEKTSAILVVDEPGKLELEIDAQQRALLSLTESYHEGWRADAGRQALMTLPLYGDYLGVLLEPGRYRLVLTFAPRSLRYGWYLTCAGLLGASVLLLVAGRRRARL
jgi:hypothetical protein